MIRVLEPNPKTARLHLEWLEDDCRTTTPILMTNGDLLAWPANERAVAERVARVYSQLLDRTVIVVGGATDPWTHTARSADR